MRNAIAAVFNLETLLRNASVPWRTLLDLVPELRASSNELRSAFDRDPGDPTNAEIGRYGAQRLQDLDALLSALEPTAQRDDLAQRAGALADDLEATADLLALLDRAGGLAPTEVSLGLVAREARRMSGPSRGREVRVRFDESAQEAPVMTDPYVLGPLLSLVIACVHANGRGDIVLRARSSPGLAFVVESAGTGDAQLPELAMRVMARIPPTESAAKRVGEKLGARVELEPGRGSIVLASPAG